MIGIYIVTNLVNGKRYIGQSKNIQRRFWEHRCVTHEENKELRRDLELNSDIKDALENLNDMKELLSKYEYDAK